MPPDDHAGEWEEYRQYILRELQRLDTEQREQQAMMNMLRIEVAKLKVTATVLGAAAGALLNLIGSLLALVRH